MIFLRLVVKVLFRSKNNNQEFLEMCNLKIGNICIKRNQKIFYDTKLY